MEILNYAVAAFFSHLCFFVLQNCMLNNCFFPVYNPISRSRGWLAENRNSNFTLEKYQDHIDYAHGQTKIDSIHMSVF